MFEKQTHYEMFFRPQKAKLTNLGFGDTQKMQ